MLLVGLRRGDAEERGAGGVPVRLRLKRKSKESFIDAYTVTSGRVVIFWYGRKESARGHQCYTVKFPKSALYRYFRSGANMLLVGLVRRGDAEEQAACRVRLRLKRQ